MNHSFIAGRIDSQSCAKCKRDEISHTAFATCEACGNKGICEIFADSNMLLCMGCFTKEAIAFRNRNSESSNQVVRDMPAMPSIRQSESNAVERLNSKLQNEYPATSMDYFNFKTTSLMDVEQQFMSDESIPADKRAYEFAKFAVSMHTALTANLHEAIDIQIQCMSEMRAVTSYLNSVANKLRKEEQTELKIKNVEYTPKEAPAPKRIKVNPADRLAENMAKSLGVSIETAKQMMADIVTKNRAKCTCAETPGLCKAHPAA